MIRNIGIIGVGGVGGYFGGKLCQLLENRPELNISFIARGKHLEAIARHGLYLSTADEGEFVCRPTLATDNIQELPPLDLCLLCVKSYDLRNIVTQLKERVTENTFILPLLNGVDIYERIREQMTDGIVSPACVYVGTHIETYGKVTQKGGACKILFGKDPQHPEYVPQEVFELFTASRIKYHWFDDPYPEIWQKYVFISAFGLVTACFDKTTGQVMESPELRQHVKSIMEEIAALAEKKGVRLPENIVENSLNKGNNFPYETKTSFQRDVEQADKPDERDLFGGTILRLGEELGIETPTTRQMYERLQAIKAI